MNYKEGIEKSLTVKWKVSLCQNGKGCWCRIIEPKSEIKVGKDEKIYIVNSGSLPKEHAEHIVKLHNKSLKNK
jgi:hypothetical protein